MSYNKILFILLFTTFSLKIQAEDGYELWLRYAPVTNAQRATEYKTQIKALAIYSNSATMQAATEELNRGLSGLLKKKIPLSKTGNVIIGSAQNVAISKSLISIKTQLSVENEGYIILSKNGNIYITGNTDIGVLYGVFHFLRLMQTEQSLNNLNIVEKPKVQHRVLNHWDNLNRHVERGYAGQSIWDWHRLPDYIDPRYKDYARANASIGINGVSPINVNANAQTLTPQYLEKVKALGDIFRPYGIKMYLTARFSAPI